MRKLTILVDMDDTIEGLTEAWLAYLNERYGLSVTKNSMKEWNVREAYPTLTDEQVFSPLRDASLWEEVKPYNDAVEYIKKLIDRGHDVYILTSSHYDTVKLKFESVLFKYFPFIDYSHVIITSRKQMVKGDILIDDYPDNLIGGSYWGIVFDQPYNHEFNNKLYSIERVYNWKQIYELLINLE